MSIFSNKKDETMDMVVKTYDYKRFKFYDWNRDVSEQGLKRLDESVQQHGWKSDPIIVDPNYGVIDGQHRLVYAKRHHLPIYYLVENDITPLDCQRINSNRRAWTLQDYIKYHAFTGNEDYMALYKMIETFKEDIPILTIIYAYSDKENASSGGIGTRKIKEGLFKRKTDDKTAAALLDYLVELIPYIKQVKGRVDVLGRAIIFACQLEEIDTKRLANMVKAYCHSMTPAANVEIAIKELERIYNLNKKKDRVYLWTEYQKAMYENSRKGTQVMNQKRKIENENNNSDQ